MSVAGTLALLTTATPPSVPAAVFVHKGRVGAHVGLAYHVDDLGEFRLLHQAWHLITSPRGKIDDHAEMAGTTLWWVLPGLDEDDLVSLRSASDRVARGLEQRQLPYAFDPADAAVTREGVVDLGASVGLTCATFTMLVFAAAKVPLLESATWEGGRSDQRKADDKRAFELLAAELRRRDSEHADRIAGDVGCVRFRAEEIAACSGCTSRPVPFATAEPLGHALLAGL